MIKRLTLAMLASLLLTAQAAIATESGVSKTTEQEALAINYYAIGKYRLAIRIWRQLLTDNPHMEPNRFSEISILMASAQKSLGFPRQACSTLQKAIDANPYLCDLDPNRRTKVSFENLSLLSRYDLIAAITLVDLLRDFGKFDRAKALLEFTSPQVQQFNDPRLIAGVQLSTADLMFMQLKLKRDRVAYRNLQLSETEFAEIESSFRDAYQLYESAFGSPLHRDAVSKWLRLHEEHRKFRGLVDSSSLIQSKSEQYQTNLDKLLNMKLTEATEVEKIQFKLEVAQRAYEFGVWRNDKQVLMQTFQLTAETLKRSTELDNVGLLSEGYGHLGKLYLLSEQYDEALTAFERASKAAQRSNDVHQLYQWQHELAKLFERQDNTEQAASYFEAAIATLKEVEWDVSPLGSELRLNFQEKAAPIFEDYLSFLLNNSKKDFQKIIQVQTAFKTSKLQNYLGCGTLSPIPPDKIFENYQNVALIHIFNSQGKLHILLQSPQGFTYRTVNQEDISQLLNDIRLLVTSLQDKNSTFLREKLQQLYRLLITPIEDEFQPEQSLIFSLDSSLEQIPMAMLFDGKQYLIEKHPVVLSTLQLYEPKALTNKDAFFAGLSEPKTSQAGEQFSPLPYVDIEAQAIRPKAKIINQSFTQQKLIEGLTQYSIVHVASHGQFSSDPNETFLLAWDQKVTIDSLASVVGFRAQNTPDPIDLLVLSACETAKGDRIATLGMAGFTVQAGARSTLASLWRSEDQSTANIMQDFYYFWRSGHTKAKALQLAQLQQIQQGRSPIHWGNFVLVGSWL